MNAAPSVCTSRGLRQQGYTIVEVLVAILIALFLLGGLATVVQDNRRTATNQAQLAQLQDQERLAMSIITNVIQSAGYFPDPTLNSPATLFAGDPPFKKVGQPIAGTGDWGDDPPGDKITVRYATVPGDGVLLCTGGTNPGAAGDPPTTFVNALSLKQDLSDPNPNHYALVCNLSGGADTVLVGGLTNMQIRYGVRRAASGNSVDSYVDVSKMSDNDWDNIISVKVQLTFDNPLYMPSQDVKYKTITFTRVISVMANAGVSTT